MQSWLGMLDEHNVFNAKAAEMRLLRYCAELDASVTAADVGGARPVSEPFAPDMYRCTHTWRV